MEFTDYQIRSLRRKIRPQVIVDRTSGDILVTLGKILCTEIEEMTIIDGRGLTNLQWLREQLSGLPDGYIVFTHLSEIPDSEDATKIKSLIYLCVKGDWRNLQGVTFSEEILNELAHKQIGVVLISGKTEYKDSRDFKYMSGQSVCTYCAISDNGYEFVE